ncbi:MAG: HRDC domain-containing protein, partial [Phycisphaerae bacterium]|nr:HRDC domain-containing protein [Phycisphaerae bacterium]
MNHRRKKRSMEHAAAEHHTAGGTGRAPIAHPLVPAAAATVIADSRALRDLLAHLESHPVVAFDTEFIGEESFYPKVCLVQVATPAMVALVDPVPLRSDESLLTDLFRTLTARGRTVLVHAGDSDLGILRRGADAEPETVIDTQVAAALCWMPWPSSLGTVLETLTGYRLGKAHTFTNWDARPLSASQLRYAADDVRYLALMWRLLTERLTELGRLDWALAECREQMRASDFTPDAQLRRLGRTESMRPGQRMVARELVALRYELARVHDLPTRTVIPDAAVVEMSKRRPADRGALGSISGLPRRILASHADEVLAAIERGRAAEPEPEPASAPMDDPRVRAECDALWTACQVR